MWIVCLILGFILGMGVTFIMLGVSGGNHDKEE